MGTRAHDQRGTGLAGTARRYAVLSIAAAVLTIGLKFGAYLLTGSVGLFSDAAESVVNLVAAVAALWALLYAARPPDEDHAFGHDKAEYFSSGLESALILLAAGWIGVTAWDRLMEPQPLQNVGLGLSVTLVAAALNGGVALVLMSAGQRLRSITLRADAQHLLTDVWTSIGVVVGIVMVQLTGWLVLDPLIGLLVAANILWTGCACCATLPRACSTAPCRPRIRRPSPGFFPATKRKASGSTPCARGPLVHAVSSRCTSSCRAGGRAAGPRSFRRHKRRTSPRRCRATAPSSST